MPDRKSEKDVLFNNGVFPVIISDFHNESILKVNNVFIDWFRHTNPDISIISINGKRIQVMEQLKIYGFCENFSLTVQHKNGKNIRCIATASVAKDDNEKEKIVIIIHESLENKEETESLRNQSANLYALSENIDGIFWSVDSSLNVVNYNTEFTKNLEETFDIQIKIGDNILEKMPQNYYEEWKTRYKSALEGEKDKYIDNMLGGIVESSFIPIFSEYH